MADGKPFDPGRYLTKVGSADYLETKWRLVWLREVHPLAELDTEAVTITAPTANPEGEHEGYAVFKATIRLPGGGSASGYGSETYNDFRDYIEKAETKAIGRACAALGFGTQFCDDFAFGDGAKGGRPKIVDSPVDPAKFPARTRTTSVNTIRDTPDNPPEMITQEQIDRIKELQRQKGVTNSGLLNLHGRSSAAVLSVDEADKLIITMNDYPDVTAAQAAMIPAGADRWTS